MCFCLFYFCIWCCHQRVVWLSFCFLWCHTETGLRGRFRSLSLACVKLPAAGQRARTRGWQIGATFGCNERPRREQHYLWLVATLWLVVVFVSSFLPFYQFSSSLFLVSLTCSCWCRLWFWTYLFVRNDAPIVMKCLSSTIYIITMTARSFVRRPLLQVMCCTVSFYSCCCFQHFSMPTSQIHQ